MAPEANAYEFQSKAIVDMLSKLLGKFDDERTALEEEETAAKNSFSMLKADLANQLAAANEARTQNAERKAKALQGAADSKGALQDTVTTRDDDEKYTADLTATCEQKSTDFANRQILRGEEIEAIQKAIEILAGGAVSGASEKHLPQLLQAKAKAAALAFAWRSCGRCFSEAPETAPPARISIAFWIASISSPRRVWRSAKAVDLTSQVEMRSVTYF